MTYEEIYDKVQQGYYQSAIVEFQHDCISYLTSATDMPERMANKVFNKAWQDGHSWGLRSVLYEVDALREVFE